MARFRVILVYFLTVILNIHFCFAQNFTPEELIEQRNANNDQLAAQIFPKVYLHLQTYNK